MPFAIFALAAINIAIGTQSFVFAGLLTELARDLGVSIGAAGLLGPATSITFAAPSPLATSLVSGFGRKRVMVIGCPRSRCATRCALAPSFGWLFGLRILGGVVTALAGSLPSVAVTALVTSTTTRPTTAVLILQLASAMFAAVPMNLAQLSQLAGLLRRSRSRSTAR